MIENINTDSERCLGAQLNSTTIGRIKMMVPITKKIGKWFSKVNEHQMKCNVCIKTFNTENKGIGAIRRHAAGPTHKNKLAKAKENEDASRETIPIVEPLESAINV